MSSKIETYVNHYVQLSIKCWNCFENQLIYDKIIAKMCRRHFLDTVYTFWHLKKIDIDESE